MYDLVILYSGGADSRVMLELCNEFDLKPYCLMIDYGQLHLEELKFAKSHLEKALIDHQTVKISGLNVDSGLTGDGVKNDTGEVHEMHVPGRNTMFLSVAYSIAESKGIDTIWLGSDWDDRLNLFPDCYQEYIVAMNEAFKLAGPKPIKIEAPLSGLSKVNIIKMLKKRGVEDHEIFSGYGDL
jgi:7-cyano-7-deazaguanine synthase